MAAPVAASATAPPQSAIPHGNMAEILPSLPLETRCPPFRLRHYGGFWLQEYVLRTGIPGLHACFEPGPNDVLLASFPKSGTTWIKALAFATLNRAKHQPVDTNHPLRRCNPHDCVTFLETDFVLKVNSNGIRDESEGLHSPRVLATHLPYSLLPECITGEGSGSRIVYICRNPKDVLVSGWFFTKKVSSTFGVDTQLCTLQEAFDLFCEGHCIDGPQWQHVLEYWEESLRRPDKVLFLRYDEILREPVSNLKKLAEFMGCALTEEEEKGGVVDAILELCSLPQLKNMEVNKNGSNYLAIKNYAYFRTGVIGDWSNHLTLEMAEKLDKIVEEALQGSGLTFSDSP